MSDNDPLSINEAVSSEIAAIDAVEKPPEKVEATPAETPETELEAAPTAEDAIEPETATEGETEAEGEQTEGDEPEPKPLNPPRFWDADDKEAFGKLSREDQERVLKYDTLGVKATSEAIEKAAVARKTAEAETTRITQLNGILEKVIPQAIETFKGRWEGVDWNQVIDQQGAEVALKLQNDMRAEQGQIQQLQAAKEQAENVRFKQFVETEAAKLPELAPELADPKLGPQRKVELGKFLVSAGVPAASIPHMSALEASIAYDAMRFRNANSKAKTLATTPKPAAVPSKTAVKPSASVVSGSTQVAALKSLQSAFNRDPSVKNLQALEEARERTA